MGILKLIKQEFHQHKRPISTKNIDINKIVVSNKFSFHEKGFKYSIGYKNVNIRPFSVFLKWAHIEETLMKFNICLFL